jgi:hypothetical protein
MADVLFLGGTISNCVDGIDVDRSGSADIADLSLPADLLFGSGESSGLLVMFQMK